MNYLAPITEQLAFDFGQGHFTEARVLAVLEFPPKPELAAGGLLLPRRIREDLARGWRPSAGSFPLA